MSLAGKTALVTGGARRVGRAIVEELARAGARVVIHHHGSTPTPTRSPRSLARRRRSSRPICASAAAAGAASSTRPLAATGALDILVNSAAGYARTPLAAMDDDAWDDMLALNLGAPMRMMREAARAGVGCHRQHRRRRRLAAVGQLVGLRHVEGGAPAPVALPGARARAAHARQLRRARHRHLPRRLGRGAPRGAAGQGAARPRRLARRRRARRALLVRRGVSDRRLHPRRRRRRPAIRSSTDSGRLRRWDESRSCRSPSWCRSWRTTSTRSGPPDLEKSIRRRSIDARLMRLLCRATCPATSGARRCACPAICR